MLARLLRRLLGRQRPLPPASPEERARRLIAAIDAGGIPLNPIALNRLARELGLEVSRQARPEETVARIRALVARL
ncbi:hypothetical protein [Azospira sp. I09]|uniref:hypothetical protein n=1 Tax=Azospira sp. I09 TaxID=1765049 RepID=UPI001260AA91|nr:hypothetical protein [Azospira sp. I09]BBN89692.1 hypothetical protein AZSP09_27150 [Azospira sp. I09]